MKHLDTILNDIAAEHLGIPTLATRQSDQLDFHDVAAWQLKAALTAAFELGRCYTQSPARQATQGLTPFDGYEIHGVANSGDEQGMFHEPVEDAEAEMWTLFGHIPGQGLEAVGDFRTREHAEEVFTRITGRRYS